MRRPRFTGHFVGEHLVPGSVRLALEGQTFASRAEFRGAFWRAVADDPSLAGQFTRSNQRLMSQGKAPFVAESQQYGGRLRYELHHITPVSRGGAEFDLGNIAVVTPRYHRDILDTGYHYGGGR
jgi:hypothetical protein